MSRARDIAEDTDQILTRRGASCKDTPASILEGGEILGDSRSDDETLVKQEAVNEFINWLIADGIRPVVVMKRFYVFMRAARPEDVMNLTAAEIGALFGQTRAAASAREKLILGETLRRAGCKSEVFGFQKSPKAVEHYAEAQRGNHTRSKSARRVA